MERFEIADLIIEVKHSYKFLTEMCKKYAYSGSKKSDLVIEITPSDIEKEKSLAEEVFPDAYLETMSMLRKISDYLIDNKLGFLFHSSALEVDNECYLFAAPSGTGKSTHAKMWREYLLDKVVMINDDKPIIRYIDGNFYAYGTPWNGKHRLDTNKRSKVKALVKLNRGATPKIREATGQEIINLVFNQTVRPEKLESMDNLLFFIDELVKRVGIYDLECDISVKSAQIAYEYMNRK